MNPCYETIREYVDSLHIIDTHEHLPKSGADSAARAMNPRWDILSEYLLHYMSSDLRSAGLPAADLSKTVCADTPIETRWALVEPYWNAVRHTGYARALDLTVRDLYGVPGLHRDTIAEADKKFRAANTNANWYETVLKDKSKIIISLLDSNLDCDPRYFRSVFRLEPYFFPRQWDEVRQVEQSYGSAIHCFEDWLDACAAAIENAVAKGVAAYKIGMAYKRSLAVERPVRHEAEAAFNEFFKALRAPEWSSKPLCAPKAFQDYMLHFILARITKRGLPVQVHTGLLEGNGNMLGQTNPTLLCNLFLEYPDIRFDIFHMGYPYQQELSALAKMFPNVHIDMCWAHIISPTASRNALVEWLDAVPANKISAFGGDYCLVDGVYGHQLMARENVSAALAQKVRDGVFDTDEAKRIAKLLFVDNPAKLFNLQKLVDAAK